MWENAASFGAMIVFGEHRYWGKSLIGPAYPADPATPPGAKAGVDYAYLTHEQALADYASLIYTIKHELDCIASPVVAFGGSYGGMLAGWARIVAPQTFIGSIAASAPVRMIMSSDTFRLP